MRRRALLISAVILIAVGVVGLAAVVTFGSFVAQSTPSGGSWDTDRMFIERMIPHHQDAIDMAEMAEERAERREVRELAERIATSQAAENKQMREWYREWFGSSVSDVDDLGGGMMGGMMGGGTDLEQLRDAPDFDREFIEQMVPHHRMAIMMARMAGSRTERSEMRRLTDSIIETQSDEIRDMQRWYRDWYGS